MAAIHNWLIALAALATTACAAPQHRPYDPAQRERIQRLAVLTPALPEEYDVRMVVHPGESLGVVGMLLAQGDMLVKSDDFNDAVRSQGFGNCRTSFRQHLEAGLSASGYELVPWKVWRPHGQLGFMDRYPTGDGSVDAYLDLYSGLVGYTAAGANTPYRPTVYLNVRLVRASDHRVLYQDRIAYNPFGDGGGAITLTAERGYEFRGFEQLVARPDHAMEGLQVAMRATGEALAMQLR
ncbi:hypothetical protein [Panacagrimonas sp.]|uniref:hypothetical protein n=1 Tax=Panacagrimonas sp. TaxID=2480088 RepID=UPI003B52623B